MKLTSRLCAIVFLAFLTPVIWAQDGIQGALSRIEAPAQLLHHTFSQQIVAGDFDNDQRPDGAVLLDVGQINGQRSFRLEIHLSTGTNTGFAFSSPESALSISALDVNADGLPDIIVQKAFTHERLQVWLNDGHGSFRKVNSENYPSRTGAPTQFQARTPEQNGPANWLPAKVGTEVADVPSRPLCAPDSFGLRNLWSELLLAHSLPRAPNPARGPPSLLSSL
jgi:hypothetical protein